MGRFSEPPDPVFAALNASIGFDRRLAPYDVRQSKAHVSMLAQAGIVTDAEA
jgi:argininosuccinate lyase